MSNIPTYTVRGALEPFVELMVGKFFPNGASAVDNTKNVGRGFTVTRTGVGVLLVTLEDGWPALLAAIAGAELAAAADVTVHVGAVNMTAKTFEVRTFSAGAAVDIAANSGNMIHLVLALQNGVV